MNRLACIESNSRKAHVLVFGEHADREQIGFAKMIHKPTNITIELGINAVDLSNLEKKTKSPLNTHKYEAIQSVLKLHTHFNIL